MSRITLALIISVTFGYSFASGQSIQLSDLPGYEKYQAASKASRELRSRPPSRLSWSDDGKLLYFSIAGKRKQVDLSNGEIDVADNDSEEDTESADSPRRRRRGGVGRAKQRTSIESPDGQWKAVYRDHNIILEPIGEDHGPNAEAVDVTSQGNEKHRFGTACWVYGEELNQNDAMWFSPDSKKLAFYEIDESHMKTYFLTTRNTQVYTNLHKEQYPTAGQDNPHVALHIYDLDSQSTTKVKIDGPIDQYIYGIDFSPSGDELIFHRTNRWQNELDIMAANVDSGSTRKVVSETQDTWQKNSPMMRFLKDGNRFVWETEKTGWKQFELRSLEGHQINPLTPNAEYPVQAIVDLDEESGWLYYSAYSGDNPLNQHLHRVRLDGSEHTKLTSGPFHHSSFRIAPDDESFVANYETIDTPSSTAVFDMEGREIAALVKGDKQVFETNRITPSELFSFTSADGKATIFGILQKPRDFDPNKTYPLLIDVYGGPLSTGVMNRFQAGNPYCEFGFLIAKIGNRGTVNRGKAFESANYLDLGGVDMDDQATGVRHLTERSYIDADRVGISGHSYGGYMSALALLKHPEVFHVGVAGAPVTDWKNYDTIYTERYMRTPKENKEGYTQGSCLKYAKQLKGKLFILHGLVDDNVHPSNTWQLVDALQKAGKRFDMMIYPNNAHGFSYSPLKWEYFVRHLKPQVDGESN